MKNKLFIICILIFSFLLSFSHLSKTFHSHAKVTEDYIPTTLPQSIPIKTLQGGKLLADQKITQSFVARYDNLGTIAVRFDKPKGYTDTIFFRIKENHADTWAYEQTYQAHTFNTADYFTFGFPPIADSKNQQYSIELESLKGREDASLTFHPSSDSILAKYSYSKAYLLANAGTILPFLKERISIYCTYVPLTEFLYTLFLFTLPFLTVKFLSVFWHISKQLENNKRFFVYMNYIAPIMLFILTIGIYGYFSSIGADTAHDGAIFKPAYDVASGLMLFRDTFYQYGALTALIHASALLLFGKYLITLKLLTVFFYGCIVLLGYGIARKFLPVIVAFFIFLVWIFMAPYFFYISYNWTNAWSSVYAIFFQLLTSYFLIRSLETKRDRFIILGGITTALTFWSRQPVGIFLFFAVTGFYIVLHLLKSIPKKELQQTLRTFILANAGVSLVFLFWITANRALNDWWRQSILFAFSFVQERGYGHGLLSLVYALFPPSIGIISVWSLIPLATIILCIRYVIKVRTEKNKNNSKIILLLTLIGLSSWLQYFPYNDPAHAFWGATPMFSLLAFFLYQFITDYLFKNIPIPTLNIKYITIFCIFCIFLPDLSYRAHDAIKKIQEPYYMISEPSILRNIRLTMNEKEWYSYVYSRIEEYFRKNPNGNVTIMNPESLYLTFDSRIKNFQPVYMNWGDVLSRSVYPEYVPNRDAYIKNKQPFLLSYFEILPDGYCRIDTIVRKDSLFLATPCQFLTAE